LLFDENAFRQVFEPNPAPPRFRAQITSPYSLLSEIESSTNTLFRKGKGRVSAIASDSEQSRLGLKQPTPFLRLPRGLRRNPASGCLSLDRFAVARDDGHGVGLTRAAVEL
jgi:hypothetical protein